MEHIYRVENSQGNGPYISRHNNSVLAALLDGHMLYSRTPGPCSDKLINRYAESNEIFGFKTKAQAKRWFTDRELRVMYMEGFGLKKVTVKKITVVSHKQVMAIR